MTGGLQQADLPERIHIEHIQYTKLNSHFWIKSYCFQAFFDSNLLIQSQLTLTAYYQSFKYHSLFN